MISVNLKNVFKSFSSDGTAPVQPVIDGLSFSVRAGESVALMGPSGSGKSTILNLIAGLDLPNAGDIIVDGLEINRLSSEARESFRLKTVSYVFQSFHLLPTLTALENCALIAFEQRDREPEQIIGETVRTLEELGISDAMNKYPSQLSGGMQARVSLARALVANPKLILADEPTGNLDSKTGERVLDFLFREQEKRKFTLLLVTHDQHAADRAERIIHLRDGRVFA
jgi:putative ABC transport system ATP-binding protein